MELFHLIWSAGCYSDHHEDYLGCYSSDEKRKEAIERFRKMTVESYEYDDDGNRKMIPRFQESGDEKEYYNYDEGIFGEFNTILDEDEKYDN